MFLESLVDPDLRRHAREDPAAGDEGDLVEATQIAGIAQGHFHMAFTALVGDRIVLEREPRGKNGERFQRQNGERVPGDVLAPLLEGERLAEIVFAKGSPLEQKRADPSTGDVLNFEGSGELGFRDQVGPDEKMADSRFQNGTDYRAAGGARFCPRPRGTSAPAPRLSVKEVARAMPEQKGMLHCKT